MIRLNDEQRKLAEENMALVPFTIKRYLGAKHVFNDDLRSIGYIGLCKAAKHYLPDKGITFASYAVRLILNELKMDWRYRKVSKRLLDETHDSLDRVVYSDPEEGITLKYFVVDERADTEKEVFENELLVRVKEIAPNLYRRVFEDASCKQLAEELGITPNSASRLVSRERKKVFKEFYSEGGAKLPALRNRKGASA